MEIRQITRRLAPRAGILKRSIGLQDQDINNGQNVTANSISERSTSFQAPDTNRGRSGTASADDPPGAFRLFDAFLAGQISWFIPLALFGAIGALFYIKTLEAPDRRRKYIALMLWGGWTIFLVVFFSVFRSMTHRYYLNIVAPGVAALAGIGFSSWLKLTTRWQLKALLLPVAVDFKRHASDHDSFEISIMENCSLTGFMGLRGKRACAHADTFYQ